MLLVPREGTELFNKSEGKRQSIQTNRLLEVQVPPLESRAEALRAQEVLNTRECFMKVRRQSQ